MVISSPLQSSEIHALILRTNPLPRGALLLHVFCQKRGLLKISLSPQLQKQAGSVCCSPLSEVFLRFKEGKSAIFKGEDISAFHFHLENRKSFGCLQESMRILQLTEKLFPLGKPAEKAFDLLCFYIRCLPQCRSPATLRLSYSLKLLLLEGMVQFPKEPLAPYYAFAEGEFLPLSTFSPSPCTLSKKQMSYLLSLVQVQKKGDLLFLEEDISSIEKGSCLISQVLE